MAHIWRAWNKVILDKPCHKCKNVIEKGSLVTTKKFVCHCCGGNITRVVHAECAAPPISQTTTGGV
jgi:rRNA maturation endonuclease Nob1